MYKEVAFDPAALVDLNYYFLLKREFGLDKGRYVSAFVQEWANEAISFVKNSDLQPNKKKSIKNFLNKLKQKKPPFQICLATDRKVITQELNEPWDFWFKKQSEHREYSTVISERGYKGCLDVMDLDRDCEKWHVPASLGISKEADDILKVIEPLLMFGDELIVIDNYFKVASNPVLVGLFKLLHKYEHIKNVIVVTTMETADVNAVFKQQLLPYYSEKFSFKVFSVIKGYFHDRYFICGRTALRAGQGYSEDVNKGAHADIVNMNLIGEEEFNRTQSDFRTAINTHIAPLYFEVNNTPEK